MVDHTRSSITIEAAPAEVMAAIADFAAYPDWAGEVTSAEVIEIGADGRAREVRLLLDGRVLQDEQVYAYQWDDDRSVHWWLVASGVLSGLDGRYTLEPVSTDSTLVTYELAVDLKIPMLGLIKRQAERIIIQRALSGLKRHVEAQRTD